MKTTRAIALLSVIIASLGLAGAAAAPADTGPRERLLMDFGWRFHLGNDWGIGYSLSKAAMGTGPASVEFSDASWRRVNLPHDWAVELPFDPKADGAHGFKPVGADFPQNSVGWYRRTFDLPREDSGKRLWLEFDGVFRDCTVFMNGWFVGHHESGYSGFRYDITDVANCGGKNIVSVRVDASQFEGWFYEGAGIYRHVWLVKTSPLAIAPDGVFVYSRFRDNIPQGPAEIHLHTRLANDGDAENEASVGWVIAGPDGAAVAAAQESAQIPVKGRADLGQTVRVESPVLWSPEAPRLYKLVTTVRSGGRTVDREETSFGIRTVAFDPDRGFILNGKPYVIKGTCNHQDHAGVGSALPDGLQYFRIARLKEMGSNGLRTAHNAPTPELLDACDRLGMIVMDENRLMGSDPAHLGNLEGLVRRDRNHPSVVLWSIGNEEFAAQSTPSGGRVAATMQEAIRRIDPTRPITENGAIGNEFEGINQVIEVRGWSYHVGQDMDDYHREHPAQPNLGTEQGSTVGTRGIYADDKARGYVSAYDDFAPSWAQTAETWWSFFDQRPWLSGGFVWTGFDYRGEPTPYSWPCINSHFGILDTCGFPKDNFWYYKSWWTSEPVLHLLPHWNWAGREGRPIDVRALSNCDEVELFLNGQSLGRKAMKRDSELKWSVAYAPGALSAKGFRNGVEVAEVRDETTGDPEAIALAPDRASIDADGRDVSVVAVSIRDAQGRVVPVAANSVKFELDGPGRILGVGNGDPSCHEPDVVYSTGALQRVPVEGWRWKRIANAYAANLPEAGAQFDDSGWQPADVRADSGPLGLQEHGVFRARFTVSQEQLSKSAVELWFGKIEGDAVVYLNGRRIGSGGDSRSASVFDVKSLLHPGENSLAVVIASYGDSAGVSKGVMLQLQGDPPPVEWRRSAFNGLAEVIVQSSREGGTIRLTARSDGLEPATVSIQTIPAPQLAVLP
jgi:beta-galactosidase